MSQQTAMVKFTNDSGQEVSLTYEDICQTINPNGTASPGEVLMFMEKCNAMKLNPMVGDAYLVKMGGASPAQLMVSYHAYNKFACADPNFVGMRSGVIVINSQGKIEKLVGSFFAPEAGQQLVGGWADITLKNREPVETTVRLAEYNKNKGIWNDKPGVMIEKCAKATALRTAFPERMQNVYTKEEIEGDVPTQEAPRSQGVVARVEEVVSIPSPLTDEQKQSLWVWTRQLSDIENDKEEIDIKKELIDNVGDPRHYMRNWTEYADKVEAYIDEVREARSIEEAEDVEFELQGGEIGE